MEGGDQGLMATIDDKVVAMSFESSKFEDGVSRSLAAIDKLKKALNFQHQTQSMHGIATAGKAVDLGHIAKGAESIKAHLGALNVAAVAIFADIAKRALTTGTALAKAFTIDPMKAGFAEYTTNLNSVQTILANTQAAGATIKDVNAALDELNTYSDKTIYNFGQMARNIGTFTAAGVDLKTATASIKGIANLAALSGSNAEQAATAMYQLSQAISSGSVKLMDWNSVVNAGMGGTVFQRALAQTGEHMGRLEKGTVKLVGPMKNVKIAGESFRNSLSAPGKDGWLTSEVLTTTLKQLTGDMTDAELRADGYNKAQIRAIQAQAKAAMLAATNVKTLDQVLQVARETAGSGWAKTWRIIFGDFEEARTTFTKLSNTINGIIIDSARARNNLLGDWRALGGRQVLIEGIKNAFRALQMVIYPIKKAFRDIFPPATGKQLFDLTVKFRDLMERLKPGKDTIENLYRTFKGLFAILHIGVQIVGGIWIVIKKLFGALDGAGGGFLELTGNIGDWLVKVDKALKKGDKLNKFFEKLGDALAKPLKALAEFGSEFMNSLSGGIVNATVLGPISELAGGLGSLSVVTEKLGEVWANFVESFSSSGNIMQPVVDSIVKGLEGLGPAINESIGTASFDSVLQVIKTALLGGLVVMFKRFLGRGSAIDQITKGFGGGILKNISGSFKALQGSMVALQQNIKAKTLKEIAIAVGILTISVVALSMVDPARLKSSLAAITVAFGQLLGAMAILGNVTKTVGFIKMPVIAASLVILAGAIVVLSAAVVILSQLSWEELVKGLAGVGVSLGLLVAAVGPLSKGSAGMVRAGVGITALAVGLKILASAVGAFGGMSMTELGKGLGSVAVGLGIIVKAMSAMPVKGMVAAGVGIILLGTGLRILANAVQAFGAMDLRTLGQGLGAVALALIGIGLAMRVMPKGMILQSAALLLIAAALQGIVFAIQRLGGMSIEQLARGIGALAITLGLLAAALIIMDGAVGGAIALTVAAAGIAHLAPALETLGKLSWIEIIKGLVALAAALTLIGAAGYLIGPAVVPLMGLGVALLFIGGGLALAGAGIALIGMGLSALIVALPTGVGVMLAAFVEFQRGLVENAKLLILGLLEIVQAFADTAPQFVDAVVKILDSLADAILESTPSITKVFNGLIAAILSVIHTNQGNIIQAGWNLLLGLLKGIRNNIASLVRAVVDIITRFIGAIAKNAGKIVTAGAGILLAILKGIAKGIAGVAIIAVKIITSFIGGIASAYRRIITAGLNLLTKFISAIASGTRKVIAAGTNLIVAIVTGIGNAGRRIVTAGTKAIIKFINALSSNGVKLANAGMRAVINFLNGVATAIDNNAPEMRRAGLRVGEAIINGMTGGLTAKARELYDKAKGIADKVVGILKKVPGVRSPSTVTHEIGQNIVQGLANGMSDYKPATDAAIAMGNGVITAVEDTFQIKSPSQVMYEIGREVTEGFSLGIRKGTEEEITQAFVEMQTKFTDQLRSLNSELATAKARRRELKQGKEDKEERAEIKALNKEIARQTKEVRLLTAARAALNAGFVGPKGKILKTELLAHAKAYEALNKRIEESKAIIEEFKTQYAELPEIIKEGEDAEGETRILTGAEQLALYTEKITAQGAAITKYNETLQKLKALGLDDATYRMLLEEGTDGQAFAQALVDAGPDAIANINKLDGDIDGAASSLGDNAAINLYKAGEQAAKGLIAGLEAEKANLEKLMTDLANTMVKALKRKLKIKSPSEVFAEIGQQSMEGMAKGFSDSSDVMTDAIDDAAIDAMTAMKASMQDISGMVIDTNPVITPILDLTQVKSKAAELAALTNTVPITAAASYGQASSISAAQLTAQTQADKDAAMGAAVQFQQNNYSPTALSEVEIYRQTKNQLSQLKSALDLA